MSAAEMVVRCTSSPLGRGRVILGALFSRHATEWQNLPRGPEAAASTASRAVVEQKAAVEQMGLPKAMPSGPDPD
jgi:hypothetical protein